MAKKSSGRGAGGAAGRKQPLGPNPPPFQGTVIGASKTPEPQFPEATQRGRSDFARCVAGVKMFGLQQVTKAGQVLVGDTPAFYVDGPRVGCARFTDGVHVFEVSAHMLYVWSGRNGTPGHAKQTTLVQVMRALDAAISNNSLEDWQKDFGQFI